MQMSYERVKQAKETIIGTKQTVKAINLGQVKEIIVALDADPRITEAVVQVAKGNRIPIYFVDSKKELGKTCGIQVSATVVAITE
jgi:large subunit ribosomal protein L7A